MILRDVIKPLLIPIISCVIFIYVCVSHYLSTTCYFVCIYLNVLKWRWKKENNFWNQFDPIFEFTSSSRPDTREIQLIWIFKKSEFVWPCNFLSAIYFVLFSKIFRTNSGEKISATAAYPSVFTLSLRTTRLWWVHANSISN